MHLAGFGIYTKRVLEMAEFYKAVLKTQAEGDELHQAVQTQGAFLAIQYDDREEAHEGGSTVLVFDVKDVHAEHARLQGLGVAFVSPPTDQPWGMRNMEFLDPDGNRVIFRSSIQP